MDFYVKLCIEKVIESIYSKGTFCTKSNHGIYDEYFCASHKGHFRVFQVFLKLTATFMAAVCRLKKKTMIVFTNQNILCIVKNIHDVGNFVNKF